MNFKAFENVWVKNENALRENLILMKARGRIALSWIWSYGHNHGILKLDKMLDAGYPEPQNFTK